MTATTNSADVDTDFHGMIVLLSMPGTAACTAQSHQ